MMQTIAIERLSLPPDKETFFREYVFKSKPVVIENMVNDWPALKLWSAEYFIKNFPEAKVGMMKLENDNCDLHSYNQYVVKNISSSVSDSKWAIASPIDFFPEQLSNDYSVPEYCDGGSFLRSRIFMAPTGSVTALHRDLPENIYVMVNGHKKILLFPPELDLYPNSVFSKHPNFSQADPENPDEIKFHNLKNAQAYTVELKSGETLFIPSLWWHHLRNIEESVAINFWWSRGWKIPVTWAAVMFKKIVGV